MQINIQSNMKEIAASINVKQSQISYAAARSLNDLAFAVRQEIVQKTYPQSFKVKNQRFTSKNYESAVESYIKKIETGAIKPGEKLMVILDTHGAAKTSAHRTHSIATSGAEIKDYDNLGNNDHDSVDRLFDLAKIAEEKGVKLAILDFSCHSGNSLALANDKTCVISSSGPNHYGYSNFPATFYENMSTGKNLEDVFLSLTGHEWKDE